MTARQQQAGPDWFPFCAAMVAALVGGPVLVWVGLPGLPVVVVGLVVAGAVHPPPVLTGVRGSGAGRRRVPGTRAEERRLERHHRVRALRGLVVPVGMWPVPTALLAGVGAGLVAWSLPVRAPSWAPEGVAGAVSGWGPVVNAVAALVLVAGGERVWRSQRSSAEQAPGTPLVRVLSVPRWRLIVVAVGGVVGLLVGQVAAGSGWLVSAAPVRAGCVLAGCACGVWAACRRDSWRGWRLRERARHQWEARWAMVPKEEASPPVLVDRLVDGPLVVDTFRCRPGTEAGWYVRAGTQIAAAVGEQATVRVLPAATTGAEGQPVRGTADPSCFRVAVLPHGEDEAQVSDQDLVAEFQWAGRWTQVPKAEPAPLLVSRTQVGPYTVDLFDSPGRPSEEVLRASSKVAVGVGAGWETVVVPEPDSGVPGTVHPTRFRVVTSPQGTATDVTTAGREEVAVAVEQSLTRAAEVLRCDPVALRGLELLTRRGQGAQVWQVSVRGGVVDQVAGILGSWLGPALVDGADIILGPTEDAVWAEEGMGERVAGLLVAAEWTAHFREVIRVGDTPPVPQVGHMEVLDAGGTRVTRLPFASPQGKDVARDYLSLSQRLRTTVPQAPFMLLTAVPPTEGAAAPGARSDKFFEVVWSEEPVAGSPEQLAPPVERRRPSRVDPRDGSELVLAGMVDEAFRSVFGNGKVPQVVSGTCLTAAAPWIWRVSLRLYGGVNLADLLTKSDRLAMLLRVDWLRVCAAGDLVAVYAGARPSSTRVLSEHVRTVAELDFEHAWLSSKVVTSSGEVPSLVSVSPLEGNEAVSLYEFELPAGLSQSDVRHRLDKVATATSNGFVRLDQSPDPWRVRLMISQTNPVPTRAGHDFVRTDGLVSAAAGGGAGLEVSWGTGVDGKPVLWGFRDTPHALVLGRTGTGKTGAIMGPVYACLLAGWDVVVVDPSKGGADFVALRPWLRAAAGEDVASADATLKAVYEEVRRRKDLAVRYGARSVDELPDQERPAHVLVVVDEFTSLLLTDKVDRTRTSDPEVLAEREAVERANAQKLSVGTTIGRIAREARSAGVHLLLGTQVLRADTISRIPGGDLKSNLGRLLLGRASTGEMMSGLTRPEDAPRLDAAPTGRGLWEPMTSPAVEVQTWYASAEEYAQQLRSRRCPEREDWDVSRFMPVKEEAAYTEIDPGDEVVEVLEELVLTELEPAGAGGDQDAARQGDEGQERDPFEEALAVLGQSMTQEQS